MTFLLKHRSNERRNFRNNSVKIFWLVFLATILSAIFYWGSRFTTPILIEVVVPITSTYKSISGSLTLGLKILEPNSLLIKENQILKNRISELESQIYDDGQIRAENILLNEELGYKKPGFINARILLLPPQLPFDTLLINRGQKEAVAVGSKVFISDKVELGYVEEVYLETAKVRLLSSAGIKTPAIRETDGSAVELVGKGGGNFLLELPLNFPIQEGDIFIDSQSRRAAIAAVGSVKKSDTSSFATVLLREPLNINGNSTLLVEIK